MLLSVQPLSICPYLLVTFVNGMFLLFAVEASRFVIRFIALRLKGLLRGEVSLVVLVLRTESTRDRCRSCRRLRCGVGVPHSKHLGKELSSFHDLS